MKHVLFLLLLSLPFYFISSCKSKKSSATSSEVKVNTKKKDTVVVLFVDTANYIHLYIDSVQIGKKNSLIGETILAEKALPELYFLNKYELLWTDSIVRSKAILQLIEAWKEGLNPKDYHLESILDINDHLLLDTTDRRSKAIFDILLSDGILAYAENLNQGKLDPESLYPTWNFFSRNLPNDGISSLLSAIQNDSLELYIERLAPQNSDYKLLKENLIKYTNIAHQGGWDLLPEINTIHAGDNSAFIPLLRDRLKNEGYNVIMDSSRVYDPLLVDQVKLFQLNSGLKPDGVIGKYTVVALNESVDSKLNKIRVNMERNRWVLENELNEFIVVNIAKYQLYYSDSGEVSYTTKVMVGTDEKQTPVFRDKLEYIVFNPTWTLPTSISSKETLPHLQRDSLYLEKNNMVIINSKGEVQSDSGIVWSEYSEDYFPFILRQEPGPGNALGRVKFLFPNKYAIYLHDTPSRYLFAKEERAFSHGCIRVQNPLDFSEFILAKQDTNWTMDSIMTVIDSAKTVSVRLKKSIPIYLLYLTAGENVNGEIFFVPDIYGRDERILKALGKP
jgi:murein L,D-transpeptidase YcbB/YkuD